MWKYLEDFYEGKMNAATRTTKRLTFKKIECDGMLTELGRRAAHGEHVYD